MADPTSDMSMSALDRVCSASCTKAGITALVLSMFALSLLRPLMQIEALGALSAYVAARITLKTAVDDLDSDGCWQALRSESGIERSTLPRLKERVCVYGPEGKLVPRAPAPRADIQSARTGTSRAKDGSKPLPRPAAPTGLTVGATIGPLDEIERALSALGQHDTLRLATSIFQYRFGSSINRWVRRAFQLSLRSINENRLTFHPDPANYRFHESLTLVDIRVLSDFAYLDPSAIEQVFMEETRINFPSAGNPLTLGSSSGLVEFGLLFSVIYFWLYQREARRSPTYPAPGTLFGVFSRTPTSRILFQLLLVVPASCAGLLAFWSPAYVRIVNYAVALLVVVVCVLIARQATLGSFSSLDESAD